MSRCRAGRRGRWLVAVFALAAACGHVNTTAGSSTSIPPGGMTTTTTVAHHPGVIEVSDSDNGRTVRAVRGDAVIVVLHSTYWSMLPASASALLEPLGSPVVAPQLQGCVPGQGCGTVTARYRAVSAGHAELAAHRSTCGEALRCTPGQTSWQVTIAIG